MTTTPLRPVAAPLAERLPLPPLRRSTEIQGNVLAAFNKDFQTIKCVKFANRTQARAWLAGMLGHISVTAEVEEFNEAFSLARRALDHDPENLAATWTNLSLTYQGLEMLARNDAEWQSIKKDLKGYTSLAQGAAGRAAELGDTGAGAPGKWLFGGTAAKQRVHAVVIVASDDEQRMEQKLAQLEALDTNQKATQVFLETGRTLPGELRGHEHFGYKDGISQPGVRGFHRPDPVNKNEREGHPGAKLIPAGEFVFGYPTAKSGKENSKRPPVPAWLVNGSLIVVRRLRQDVAAFNQQVKDIHGSAGGTGGTGAAGADGRRGPTMDEAGACLVGRFKSGQPLASPVSNIAGLGPDENSFDYKDDGRGAETPCAAHIRKANPRAFANDTHRIMRRGIPYGKKFAGGTKDDKKDRGLLFVCYNTSLENQFEFLQQRWCNAEGFAGGDPDAPTGVDPVVGPGGTAEFASRLTGSFDLSRVVTTTGAVYGMTLSMETMKRLAAEGRLNHKTVEPAEPK